MEHPYLAKRYWSFELPPLSKTNEMVMRYNDVIDLSVGDPDYPVNRKIIDFMYEEALKGHTRYTEFLGDAQLRQVVCDWYKKEYNCDYTIDNVIITSGGTHAMYLLMECLLEPEDEVILIAPYYTYYEPQIQLARAKSVVHSTKAENNFEIDLAALEQDITEHTKVVIINSPNNPSGRIYQEETMKGLVALAEKHNFMLVSDDIYGALNFTDRPTSLCAYAPNHPQVASIYSFSKDYCMTGFRLGFVVAEKRIIEALRNVNEAVNFTVNAMAQRAGIYAIQNREELTQDVKNVYQKRVMYAYERAIKLKNVSCLTPDGSFYLFVDVSALKVPVLELWEQILDEAHVLVLPGTGFGEAGEGFLRIACTCGEEKLGQAFDRIEKMSLFQ